MKPVAENEWDGTELISPTGSIENASATVQQGAGRLATLNCGELNLTVQWTVNTHVTPVALCPHKWS